MAQQCDDILQLCRLCLRKDQDCIPIFASDEEGNFSELPEIVKKCLDIEVHIEDGFTSLICPRCKTMLLAFSFFKESCQDSQQRLKRMNRRKQVMELRRMSEEMIVEEESRVVLEDSGSEEDMEIAASSQKNEESVCSSGDAVRPLAIWTVLQNGQLRANTANIKEEMIVSELLDEITPPTEEASVEKEVPVEEVHTEETSRHLEHHNYCSPAVHTKDSEDKAVRETSIAEEEDWIREANEDRTVLLKSLKVPPSPRMPLAIKEANKTESEKQKKERKLSSMPVKENADECHFIRINPGVVRIHNTDSVLKEKILIRQTSKQPVMRVQFADGECKKKILISQNSKQVLRIPAVQAEPIHERNQEDPVLKISETLKSFDEEKALEPKKKVMVKSVGATYKAILIPKADETLQLVQDRSRKSNISLLKIKQKTSPLVTWKPSR